MHGAKPAVEDQPICADTWREKYRYRDEPDYAATCARVVGALCEKESDSFRQRALAAMLAREIVPAGRILAGAGTDKRVTWINCYVSDDIQDSMRTDPNLPGRGIMDALARAAYTQQMGGGIGMNFSTIRPRGAKVFRTGSVSSGVLPFMDMWDAMCATIRSSGSRRGAQMGTLGVWHPDIEEFIEAKQRPGRLTNFNVSVMVTEDFMRAVEEDAAWHLTFPAPPADLKAGLARALRDRDAKGPFHYVRGEGATRPGSNNHFVYKVIRARELWDKITAATYVHAEPGVIFIDRVNQQNNLAYCEEINCCNPCVVGGTLVAVAGRGPVPIEQLAREGEDVPVFAVDPATGETVVRWGRRPRLTGRSKPTVRVVLDDGSFVRCTPNHKFPLRDGREVEARHLQSGDSLFRFDSRLTKRGDVFVKRRSNRDAAPEYHLIAETKYATKFPWGRMRGEYHCHHIDGDHQNNAWDNIEVKLAEDHNSDHKMGDANPMRDWWSRASEAEKRAYRESMSASQSGELNGMYGRRHSAATRRRIGAKTSERMGTSDARVRHGAAVSAGFTSEGRAAISAARRAAAVDVELTCASCGKSFTERRARGKPPRRKCCSVRCAALLGSRAVDHSLDAKARRAAKVSAALKGRPHSAEHTAKIALSRCTGEFRAGSGSNHKVVVVVPDSPADVYNMTVDEFHNYAVVTSITSDARYNHIRYSGVKIANCGEQFLPAAGACNLGHTNLAVMVDRPFELDAAFRFDKLEAAARIMVRLLDNVLDLTPWPLEEQAEEARNKRRIGLGFTGLASALQQLGIPYGSEEAVEFARRVARTQAVAAYRESVDLAKERGSFPLFDRDKFCAAPFVRKLPDDLRQAIRDHGIRNGVLLSIAPTGTTSLAVGNVSSGIEPVFAHRYRRRVRGDSGEMENEYSVYDYGYLRWCEHAGADPEVAHRVSLPPGFVTADQLTVEQHLQMAAAAQEWVDSAISKTINCPTSMTIEEFRAVYTRAYELGLKGCTTYRLDPRSGRGAVLISDGKEVGSSGEETEAREEEGQGQQAGQVAVQPPLDKIPMQDVVEGRRYRIRWPAEDCAYYVVITDYVDPSGRRRPFELFISTKSERHSEWVKAFSLLVTAIFRREGDPSFVVDELRSVFSAQGGSWVRVPWQDKPKLATSLVAAIGLKIEEHMRWLGMIGADEGLAPGHTDLMVPPETIAEFVAAQELMDICDQCGARAVIYAEGCATCHACGRSDCG